MSTNKDTQVTTRDKRVARFAVIFIVAPFIMHERLPKQPISLIRSAFGTKDGLSQPNGVLSSPAALRIHVSKPTINILQRTDCVFGYEVRGETYLKVQR